MAGTMHRDAQHIWVLVKQPLRRVHVLHVLRGWCSVYSVTGGAYTFRVHLYRDMNV
jgi:hypothetical protein